MTELQSLSAVFRPKDLQAHGLSRDRLRTWIRRGDVELLGRGLYRRRAAPITEHETVMMVAIKAPGAIICLLTALHLYQIGTQAPGPVWIALDRKARKPNVPDVKLRVVRFSGPMLRYGVVKKAFQGVPVQMTSPARTVVDCFRYRQKVGIDVALEALRNLLRSRRASVSEIMRAADVCRARTIVQPYLEALSS
jgi:predicted transcriptional regulator of viral defense system